MEEKFSTSILLITAAFIASFVLSLTRSEYLFGIISLGFALLIYILGFILARQHDAKDVSNQIEG